MPNLRAIGPFSPQDSQSHPKDWIYVRLEPSGERELLPHGTLVDLQESSDGRDHFTILDFWGWAGKRASLSHENGKSRLVAPIATTGPVLVQWNSATKLVRVTCPPLAPLELPAVSDPKVPDGRYRLRPKASRLGATWVGEAPHAWSWWLIEYQPERAFCFHTGGTTLGCITVTDRSLWERAYSILHAARTQDRLYTGDIEISGHSNV